jgi:hypothetical protein
VSTARNLKLAPTTKRPRPDLLADLVRIRRGLLVAVDRAATAVAYVHDVEVLAGVAKDIERASRDLVQALSGDSATESGIILPRFAPRVEGRRGKPQVDQLPGRDSNSQPTD